MPLNAEVLEVYPPPNGTHTWYRPRLPFIPFLPAEVDRSSAAFILEVAAGRNSNCVACKLQKPAKKKV